MEEAERHDEPADAGVPTEVEDLIHPTSKKERAWNIALAYHDLGAQLDDLVIQQDVNNWDDDHPIAWAPAREGNPNGWLSDAKKGDVDGSEWEAPGLKLVSVGARREQLKLAKLKLYRRNERRWSDVEEALPEVQKLAQERAVDRLKPNPNPGARP